jgi:hypothetical protein
MDKKKIKTVFERIANFKKNNDNLKAIFYYKGYLYCMNGYMAIKVKGNPDDISFDSEVKTLDDTVERYFANQKSENVTFDLPSIEQLKADIRERMYSRAKGKLFDAKYRIVDKAYVNAFFLLDAMTILPKAYGSWSGTIATSHDKDGNINGYYAKGVIHIISPEGEAIICPIKVPGMR